MKEECVVLDACALIAFFNDEPGADRVEEILTRVADVRVAAVNVLEVAYDAVRRTGQGGAAVHVLETTENLPCRIEWCMSSRTLEIAARLKGTFRISLADAIALGLAEESNAPLATSDHHEFEPIEAASRAKFIWIR